MVKEYDIYFSVMLLFHFMATAEVSGGEYESHKAFPTKRKVKFMIQCKSSINTKYQEIQSFTVEFFFS